MGTGADTFTTLLGLTEHLYKIKIPKSEAFHVIRKSNKIKDFGRSSNEVFVMGPTHRHKDLVDVSGV